MTFPATHPALQRALAARGYSEATAVQQAVLQETAVDRDLLVSAQTGSGKTVAFGLAMARALLQDAERFERAGAPLALIIAPTRELAMQVQRELDWLYADTGGRVITCVGGMDVRAEARQLYAGAHIVVGTPGRLRDHIERNRLDLSTLKAIVLDEADEMLDLGFREDLEFILERTPEDRQSLLFSATLPSDIEAMAERFQRNALRIETLRRNEQHSDIDYAAVRVAPSDVEHAVVNVLRFHEARAAIVFCATREGVRRLHARLVERGFSAVALSGELTQNERSTALQAVRDGRARVLVATDVAARGLDLPDLALVIHADLPINRESLLHRSGRTGRAGRKGLCVLIVPFNRRRKAEALIGSARLKVTWGPAPSADDIRARDAERFLAHDIFAEAPTDEDAELARTLQGARSADEIALALVRMHRARLPAAEDLAEDLGPPPRRFDNDRSKGRDGERWTKRDSGGDDARYGPREDRPHRPHRENSPTPRPRHGDGREMVWFRLNIGRERNADPRWLLPLICRAGNVSKAEIGSIRIFDRDTRFEIAAEHADAFEHAARTAKTKEGAITRVGAHLPAGAPPSPQIEAATASTSAHRETASHPARRREDDRPRGHAKPHRKGAAPPWKAKAKEHRHNHAKADAPADGKAKTAHAHRSQRPDAGPAVKHDVKPASGQPAARPPQAPNGQKPYSNKFKSKQRNRAGVPKIAG